MEIGTTHQTIKTERYALNDQSNDERTGLVPVMIVSCHHMP